VWARKERIVGFKRAVVLLVFASGALAEPADTVVVTASRVPVPASTAGSSVSVIDREQIEKRQSVFAVDLLQDVPGVAVSQSGSIGSQTQVRIRGSEANQVLVLVDGIRANDPAGNDEFGFQDLTTWDIERIEVVRGPQSALWGSDALAGVINVITRRSGGELSTGGFAEYGSFDTVAAGARVGGTLLSTRVGLSASVVDSDGTNTSRTGGEQDGYDNKTATLTLAGSPLDNLELTFVGRYTDATKMFDGTDFLVTGLPADTGDRAANTFGYYGAGAALDLLGGRWIQSLRATLATTDTDNSNEYGENGSTASDKYGIHYQTTYYVAPPTSDSAGQSVTLAADYEQQEFSQRGLASPFGDPNQDQDLSTTSLVAEYIAAPLRQTSVSVSVRYDDNSDFDDVTTYRVTSAWTAASLGTRIHASYGTGQKAPTFIERFGFYPDQFIGNADLKPEESKGWEVGVEQPLVDRRVTVGVTYFNEVLQNEVNGFVFDPDTLLFTAENLAGDSNRRGVEVIAEARPFDNLSLSASYTYLDATQPDPVTGSDTREIRRPAHTASLNANLGLLNNRLDLNLNLAYAGNRTDIFFEVVPPYGADVVDLDAYTLARIAASYRLTGQLQIYGRIDNLFDTGYEDVYGYATPGIGAYGGLRLDF
jgi:vitamin B12 transporter